MPISLRIPPEKERKIRKASSQSGKTKTVFILEAIDEKLGLRKDRKQMIRKLSGWMSHKEAEDLRKAIAPIRQIRPGDWR